VAIFESLFLESENKPLKSTIFDLILAVVSIGLLKSFKIDSIKLLIFYRSFLIVLIMDPSLLLTDTRISLSHFQPIQGGGHGGNHGGS